MTPRSTLNPMALKAFLLSNTAVTMAVLVAALAVGLVSPAFADSSAELLEKGLYTEQTVGDLSAAMTIYRQVVENDQANRPHVAQAQFRLAQCHRKQGDENAAREALERLIRDFPDQEALVAQAREALAAASSGFDLHPVPWQDGEVLEYRMSLPTGKLVGSMELRAHATVVDGVEAWELQLRRFVRSAADNQGVSRVWVDARTQQPIRSQVRHGILGNADATYGLDGVEIVSGDQTHRVEGAGVYDNEQSIHLLRMLRLDVGDTMTLPLLPTWTTEVLEVDLEGARREPCQLPSRESTCVVIESGIGQTTWISTDAERYPVRVEGGGVVIELVGVSALDPHQPVGFGLDDFGFTGELPAEWQAHEFRAPDRPQRAMMRFLDGEALTISSLEIDRCPGPCPALEENAQRELSGAQKRFEQFELHDGSWTETTVDGRPAIHFAGDFLRDGEPWVQYRHYTFTSDRRFEFIFRVPADRFEDQRPVFDAIVESLDAE